MQQPTPGLVWRILGRVLVPLYYPEYRRLLIRSHVLTARLDLLCTFFAVVAPFATPGLLRVTRCWLYRLREDVAEFSHLVRMSRMPLTIPSARVAQRASGDSGFQNPWA
jgi:hypothetical protein